MLLLIGRGVKMIIRNVVSTDYYTLSPLINEWWGGRDMSGMLPKLFFNHFNNTSFVAVDKDMIIGFLIGFLSQSHPEEAYIHFVGVHPNYRKQRVGESLYQAFFEEIRNENRSKVRCITSPVNRTSIAYHTKIGFSIEAGDKIVDGISVQSNYDGPGQDRVLFMKELT